MYRSLGIILPSSIVISSRGEHPSWKHVEIPMKKRASPVNLGAHTLQRRISKPYSIVPDKLVICHVHIPPNCMLALGSIDVFQSIYTRISVTIPKEVVAVLAAAELVCSGGANDVLESGLNINEAQNDVGKGGFVRSGGGTKKPALTDSSDFDQSRLRLRLISVK
ncbi:hypothetical protein CPB85DRAFT_1255499 [Mucidula mucida]|nr:hypothetical protein CPB85DRAFT_1255499 [Mucidula mucida]